MTDLTDLHIPLDRALVCAQCSSVYALPRASCPSCTCTSAISLARVLDPKPKAEPAPVLKFQSGVRRRRP